jgi:hypothetical protein
MRVISFFIFLAFSFNSSAQTVLNGYAEVTAFSGVTFTVGNSDESNDNFAPGKRILIMQMQGASIQGFTSNNANFGTLYDIKLAGKYEEARISTVSRNGGGKVTSITILSIPSLAFDASGGLQLVTYPYIIGNYTNTNVLTCRGWDGKMGGVLAFRVLGDFTLGNNINVDGKGFLGGERNTSNFFSACDNTNYLHVPDNRHASRGEGTCNTVTDLAGRGKKVTGGGGANDINAGGGGGGAYTSGGEGGPGWFNSAANGCNPTAGGQGGSTLVSFMAPAQSRLFLGGGGGGGHQNDALASNGGNGGGIIIIKANKIVTVGPCTRKYITADGQAALSGGNDGQGGGGGGGCILLDFAANGVAASCKITVRANGGDGGDVNAGSTHGGGGGGGHGAIYNSLAESDYTNAAVTFETTNGLGGTNNNFNGGSAAGDGGGQNNTGIFFNAGTILPLDFMSLNAKWLSVQAQLNFETKNEVNVQSLSIEHSFDNSNWRSIGILAPKGSNTSSNQYQFVHAYPDQINFYRIRVQDKDGKLQYSNIVSLRNDRQSTFTLSPNPANAFLLLNSSEQFRNAELLVMNALGQLQWKQTLSNISQLQINTSTLPSGQYYLIVKTTQETIREKFQVQH